MLSEYLHLDNVLYVPKFNYNLLSVSKLIKDFKLNSLFLLTYCIIQDSLSKRMVAVEKEEVGLYKLNQMSFLPVEIDKLLFEVVNTMLRMQSFMNTMLYASSINKESLTFNVKSSVPTIDIIDLHDRLGHASLGKIKHIEVLKYSEGP